MGTVLPTTQKDFPDKGKGHNHRTAQLEGTLEDHLFQPFTGKGA